MSAVVICGCCGIRYSTLAKACPICRAAKPVTYPGRPAAPVALSFWLAVMCVGLAVTALLSLAGYLSP
jgi:hypothetical protein